MSSVQNSKSSWRSSSRLVASEKWRAKSAAMGHHATEALVDYAHPRPGMKILDSCQRNGEPAVTLAARIGAEEPGNLSSALRKAGLEQAEEETRTVSWVWPGTAEELWEQVHAVAAPFRAMAQRVPADKWDEINSEVYACIGKYIVGDEVRFGAVMVLASGTKS